MRFVTCEISQDGNRSVVNNDYSRDHVLFFGGCVSNGHGDPLIVLSRTTKEILGHSLVRVLVEVETTLPS